MRARITEYLDIDLEAEERRCNRCGAAATALGGVRKILARAEAAMR